MLIQVKISELPSYKIGMEKGIEARMVQDMQQGMQQEAANLLRRQFARRFGPLSMKHLARLEVATLDQLERWMDNILDAATVEDVFRGD
jgi:phage FluMu protein gp41